MSTASLAIAPRRAHWQIALGGEGYAEALDDLAQSISIILTTRCGSDPLRPEFGSNIWRYIDYPIDRARAHVVREVYAAIRRWEPRVRVDRVVVRLDEVQHMRIGVHFTAADGLMGTADVHP